MCRKIYKTYRRYKVPKTSPVWALHNPVGLSESELSAGKTHIYCRYMHGKMYKLFSSWICVSNITPLWALHKLMGMPVLESSAEKIYTKCTYVCKKYTNSKVDMCQHFVCGKRITLLPRTSYKNGMVAEWHSYLYVESWLFKPEKKR